MSKTGTIGKQSLRSLGTFGYLTSRQLAKLLYGATSPDWETHLRYVQRTLHAQVAEELVIALPGRVVTMPNIYTLSRKGYSAAGALGMPKRRVRPSEEAAKAHNLFFREHPMAVTDVLIAAELLSQMQPGIQLSRLYTERELKRKIFVTLSERTVCLEPDASLEFLLRAEDSQEEDWQDFFHIEVYRTMPPAAWRFKQKIHCYVTYAESGQHKALFQTPALSIAVVAQTPAMAETLKRWTEETLTEIGQPEQGERFFFRSGDTASASPVELFLTPFWQQPFSDTKTPLIIREEQA
jgi:hypothetical protein